MVIPESFIYIYHLDKLFYLPVTPETLPNSYSSRFTQEDIMNRTAPKVSYSGSGPRTVVVNLIIHTQLFALDNPEHPEVVKNLVNDLLACAYPNFDSENSKIIPPMVLLKFGEMTTIRGVITSGVNCTFSGPWLKDGTMAMASIQFTVTEVDQYSANYISQFGANPQLPTDLNRSTNSTTIKAY